MESSICIPAESAGGSSWVFCLAKLECSIFLRVQYESFTMARVSISNRWIQPVAMVRNDRRSGVCGMVSSFTLHSGR